MEFQLSDGWIAVRSYLLSNCNQVVNAISKRKQKYDQNIEINCPEALHAYNDGGVDLSVPKITGYDSSKSQKSQK